MCIWDIVNSFKYLVSTINLFTIPDCIMLLHLIQNEVQYYMLWNEKCVPLIPKSYVTQEDKLPNVAVGETRRAFLFVTKFLWYFRCGSSG